MNDYKVSDYSIFDNGKATINKLNVSVEAGKTKITESKTRLSDASIYMGPAADEAVNGCTQAESKAATMMEHMNQLSALLTGTSANYQEGDKKAENTVTSSTTATTTTTSSGRKIDTSACATADIAAKKVAFVGDVDDASQYTVEGNIRNKVKHMKMFDNTTGEEIPEDGTITLKAGETRVITVKLPTDTGKINTVVRTTADDLKRSGYSVTTSKSDLDPNPNNVDYVNYKPWSRHMPSDKNLQHTNYYDWIIHADKVGGRQISQTCEYSTDASKGGYLKAMIGLNVKVVGDDTTKTNS